MPLTGTFTRSVDDKQRVTIPRDLRAALPKGSDKTSGHAFYIVPGTDGSLGIYDEASFVQIAERLAGASPAERDVRAFSRLFYAQAHRAELDKQGRLRIPTQLAEWADVHGEAVLVGVGNYMELWNAAKWDAYTSGKKPHFDELAEAAFRMTSQTDRS